MKHILTWLVAFSIASLPGNAWAAQPVALYDAKGNPITSTASGGKTYLDVSATLNEAATAAPSAASLPVLLKIIGGWDGTNIQPISTDNTGAINVNASNPSVSSTGAAVPAKATYIAGSKAGTETGLLLGQQTMANSLACVLPSDQSAIPVTGTFWQATQPVSGTFWQATQPVSAASLPLPTGASTSALQTTGNTTLSAISAQLPVGIGQTTMAGSLSVALASNQSALPAMADTKLLTQNITSSANLNMNVNGAGTVGIQITGTWSGNINFQASTDGTNFFQIYCNKPNGTITGNTASNGNWFCPAAGYQTIQLNSTSWVSGTAVASMVASVGSNFVYPMNEVQGNLLVQAQEGGTWNITNVSGTVSLPTGASTSALQTTANTNLTTINTTLGSPFQAGGALGAGAAIIGKVGIDQTTPGTTNGVQVNAALPAGANVIGKVSIDQTTPGTTNLVSIGTNGTVQTKAPLNSTGSGSAAGATVSTVVTLTAPANAVKAYLMNLDTSTANIRWAVNRTATTTLGQQLQPGRDVVIDTTHDISIVSESGTQNYDVQWISQ